MTSSQVVRYDADAVLGLGPAAAVRALRAALTGGFDPAGDPARTITQLRRGQSLLMPSELGDWFGVKVCTIAPGNPALGKERIQAEYLLHDSETLTLRATLDGAALTTLRTPAVSVAACLPHLLSLAAERDPGLRLVVFGAGPQAQGHVHTVAAHVPVADVTVCRHSAAAAVPWADRTLPPDDEHVADLLRRADVIVAATTARDPLFDGQLVNDQAIVLAVGSHEPAAAELDPALLGRSLVVVETTQSALREAGDVIRAVATGTLAPGDLVPMAAAVTGPRERPARPLVVKTTGMSWEDLVVAASVHQHVGSAQ